MHRLALRRCLLWAVAVVLLPGLWSVSPASAAPGHTVADFGNDGRTDVSVFRPGSGTWFVRGGVTVNWGTAGDLPVPADYDGDGQADIAVFRPAAGTWFVRGGVTVNWGTAGDLPVPADYDGDGKADLVVFRRTTGTWFVRGSGGADMALVFGANGDVPAPGDYDGDGRTDVAVFHPATGQWAIHPTSGGADTVVGWGIGFDVPLPLPGAVYATLAPTQISSDPYTNASSSHRTEVEPDTFSSGSTIVSAFQVGRFFDGGSSNIGWATSRDGGASWARGFVPGITTFAGGAYDRVSDPSVAYDAAHGAWLISSLALNGTTGSAVVVSRSTDGGLTWSNPVTVSAPAGASLDKNWTVCDGTPTSPFFGRCYTEWDDFGNGSLILMSTSADGGLTWSAPAATADMASGLGGQPLVRPDGRVVVPIDNAFETAVRSFVSTDGGASWGSTVQVAAISSHAVNGGLRTSPLPSAEMDGSGRTYLVWQDCRFESGCPANDIVMSTSADGLTWSPVVRIPIDPVGSGVDHFVPGIGADRSTAGGAAHLGLAYYSYPSAGCSAATCRLEAGFVSSSDGGAHWTTPTRLAGPMALSWLPATTQGVMVGDYISTSFSGGTAHPVFAVARPPAGSVFDQAMYTTAVGLVPGGAPALAAAPSVVGAPSVDAVDRRGSTA